MRTVDGHGSDGMSHATLRGRIGYVEQSTPLLYGSLRDNLCYAAPDATNDDIDHVGRQTNLERSVNRLPARQLIGAEPVTAARP